MIKVLPVAKGDTPLWHQGTRGEYPLRSHARYPDMSFIRAEGRCKPVMCPGCPPCGCPRAAAKKSRCRGKRGVVFAETGPCCQEKALWGETASR